MTYKTIFDTKPDGSNKKYFCQRICTILNNITINTNNHTLNGLNMINFVLKYLPENTEGFISIDDMLRESNPNYKNIDTLSKSNDDSILTEEILANIEIIINCLLYIEVLKSKGISSYARENSVGIYLDLLYKATESYLLSIGYELKERNGTLRIIETSITIDIDEIADDKLKEEIISFYDYKNSNSIEEKHKSLTLIANKLEPKKDDISKIFGSHIANMCSNLLNNINIRHNNITDGDKNYNKKIADLTDEELINWYNYIYAFLMNIYINLDKLKDININNGCK